MKLCSVLNSPYSRMARIVCLEKSLGDRVSFELVETRGENNPYYNVNPSGRVPSLILDDGTVLEDSVLICWYLDNIDRTPKLHPADGMEGLEQRRVEAVARSMLDGTSLWLREYILRTPETRSETIISHERRRALRLADPLPDNWFYLPDSNHRKRLCHLGHALCRAGVARHQRTAFRPFAGFSAHLWLYAQHGRADPSGHHVLYGNNLEHRRLCSSNSDASRRRCGPDLPIHNYAVDWLLSRECVRTAS